jgi:hypothetical protein
MTWLKRNRSQLHHPRSGEKQFTRADVPEFFLYFNESTGKSSSRLCDFFS